MKSDNLVLRFEQLVLTAGFWRGLASTAILVALWRACMKMRG